MASEKRNQEETGIVKVGQDAPNWLQEKMETDTSLDSMKKHRIFPWAKLIQGQTKEALKDQFGEGSAIFSPGNMVITKKNEAFQFVTIFFFVEWCKWSDLDDTENPMIVERTFDETHEIARRAQNIKDRYEPYSPGSSMKWRFVEHLNFVGYIYGNHEYQGSPVVISMNRGEHAQGEAFCTAQTMQGRPYWSQVWELTPRQRERGKKKWWGFDFAIPEGDNSEGHAASYILEEEAEFFQSEYEDTLEKYSQKRIKVDFSEADKEPETVMASNEDSEY